MPKIKKGRKLAKKAAGKSKPIKKLAKRKTKVQYLPKGYHSITPYLIVDQAAKAIEFYKAVFEAKVVMRMDQPDGKVGHAELKIGDAKIMLADECPEMKVSAPKTMSPSPFGVHLYIKDVDKIVAKALKAGAKLTKPVEDMFYGDRSGALIDPFGHSWYVSTHIEDLTPAQTRKRAAAFFEKK